MKAAIYLRTSTAEQQPENQRQACEEFARARGYEIEGIYEEKISGWKQVERPQYELIKKKTRTGVINAVIVWRLDRWVRNRENLLSDVTILRGYNCKLHSVQEAWLEAINIEGPLGKTIQDFLLGLVGSLAEMESKIKSERIKIAVRKDAEMTKSYKGNKWGRKPISKNLVEQVMQLRNEGKSYTDISKNVFYWDKSNNKKFVSKSFLSKILSTKKN